MADNIYKIEVEVTRKSIMQNETSTTLAPDAPTSPESKLLNSFGKDILLADMVSQTLKTGNSLINKYGAMSGNDIGQKNINIARGLGMTLAKGLISPGLAALEFGGKAINFLTDNWLERRDDNIAREYLNDISGNFVNIERNTVI
ncbi:hypothetical protein DRO61_00870 [Candidatus Bathyarchaeota archaeon]|nr:MAG: hypothetical protein DRO61_00870 [Candidatus Bathyarchaeota archaeon]